MSIYRDDFFDSLYSIEAVEVFDENKDYESVVNEIGLGTVVAGYEIGIKAIKFVGTVAYTIKRNVDIVKAKEKLDQITRYYEFKDEKFVAGYELKRKMFSIKRYFEGEIEKQNEVKGIIKKFFFDKFYPDKSYTFYKNNNPVFTYFKCSDITTKVDFKNTVLAVKNKDDKKVDNAFLKKAVPNSSIKYTGDKFFFKLEDKKYEKYRYYYLALACFDSEQMVTEAINWVDREYNKIQKEKKEDIEKR